VPTLLDKACGKNTKVLQGSVVRVGRHLRDLVDDVHALHHSPKNGVERVQVLVVDEIDEELAAARVGAPLIGHRHCAPSVLVGPHEFIRDRRNGWVTVAGARRITPLNHEPVNDAMEDRAIVYLPVHQIQEITGRDRHIPPQLDHDLTHRGRQGHRDRAGLILASPRQVVRPADCEEDCDNGKTTQQYLS